MTAASIARGATRSLRIVALPLTHGNGNVNGKAVGHLTYYHFITPADSKNSNSWSKWVVAKASDLWAGLGKAQEGSWKRRAFLYGERLIDRLEFEELALKSLDPSLGPRLSNIVPTGHKKDASVSQVIPLVYPPSICASPVPHLHSLLEKRTPRHKKGFWFWLAVSPLTAPVAIIPIIPNFPFFFCAWRSWSHYRAYKASQYLDGLLQHGAITTETSPQLDAIYAKYAPKKIDLPSESQSDTKKPPSPSEHEKLSAEETGAAQGLLLTKEAVPELQKTLELPDDSTFAADLYRALEQARLRLEGKKDPQT